ncbi:hypothetical protein U158_02698, partial [Staphylococcus aureus M92086]
FLTLSTKNAIDGDTLEQSLKGSVAKLNL